MRNGRGRRGDVGPPGYVEAVPRLIHVNGPPGVGKSTLARRYAAEHPGTLLCDIDALRTLIGGWQRDADAAGRIRTTALAMITAYLQTGHDVVLPQLVARPEQLARFASAASGADAEWLHLMLVADPDVVVARFRARAAGSPDEWTTYATAFVDAEGGDEALREWTRMLTSVPGAAHVPSTDPDETYRALLVVLREES
jgi:predicted kinase